ncbi:Tether containing UBX domain for GLUT4 [Gracilariopsis chorda]|uniref:Tether containing UBX domain for GLUT4 n=1 Tax=Gracilariopsis chorda TaxID=448386 RepID=A0A2V3IXG4_9FLOR|nr:Tether containing UBX domain for GLUT4 [Gracilariopsis chorda]|eukprot:PXF46801.1 Tether containing UBX domain for GLUT4 [Gracilariopsis chorda]
MEASKHIEEPLAASQQSGKPSPEDVARGVLNDREVRVFRPSHVRFDPRKLDLPDDFFEPTASELKQIIQHDAAAVREIQERPLLTKKLRDAEKQKRMNRFRRSVIRVLFPDRVSIQGIFVPSSTIREVIRFVRAALADARNVKFHLFVVPPKKKLVDVKKTLWDEQLVPAAVVHIGIDTGPTSTTELLKPYLLEKIEDTPESIAAQPTAAPIPSPTLPQPESSEKKAKKPSASKKIPKWFRKK